MQKTKLVLTIANICTHFLKSTYMFDIFEFKCCVVSHVQVSDQVKSRFSPGLSLPQICENFLKAAYDPRISGIYLHIDSLNCGWGKVEEIRRHILDFKKSGNALDLSCNFCME